MPNICIFSSENSNLGLEVIVVAQQITRLTIQLAAKRFERAETHRSGFAGGEDVEVGRRDVDTFR